MNETNGSGAAMNELIERLRNATGPSRDLDIAIENELGLARFSPPHPFRAHMDGDTRLPATDYTSSTDAALALVIAKSGEEMAIGCLRHATGVAMLEGHSASMIPINMLVIWFVRTDTALAAKEA